LLGPLLLEEDIEDMEVMDGREEDPPVIRLKMSSATPGPVATMVGPVVTRATVGTEDIAGKSV
jgi:hypothetical protein